MSDYHIVVGFEIHVQLNTESKMFCPCSARYFGTEPNTHVCPTCLGLPGALPVPNIKAIESTILAGLALGCEVSPRTKFDRKSYFYPDLPKGYQISQYDQPLCKGGSVPLNSGAVPIRRVHLEEDTGKLFHKHLQKEDKTLIDFNRSGVPLMEIVTDIAYLTPPEAKQFLKKLVQTLRFLNISDCSMETGSMRLEVNLSLTEKIGVVPDYKVEIKNLNSFKFVEAAIVYEAERQKRVLDSGKTPIQETRGWDERKKITFSQRRKEHEYDYRYFPEPDIPHIEWTSKDIEHFKNALPVLPEALEKKFRDEYKLDQKTSDALLKDVNKTHLFERCVEIGKGHNIEVATIAKHIIGSNIRCDQTPEDVISRLKSTIIKYTMSDDEISKLVNTTLHENPELVDLYKNGRQKVLEIIIGRCMRSAKSCADPGKIRGNLIKTLASN